MRKNSLLFILLAALFMAACTSLGPIFESDLGIKKSIPCKDFELEIIDKRTTISERKVFLNPITFGGEMDSVSPILPATLNSIYHDLFNKYKAEGEVKIKVIVKIDNAYQKFCATGGLEIEYVRTDLNVQITDLNSGEIIKESRGSSWGERKSLDASHKRIEEMFMISLKQALIRALNN